MSSFIVHTKNDLGAIEAIWLTPSAVARWMLAPESLKATGQVPQWTVTVIVDPDGLALPVLEDAEQVAGLYAHAAQNTWFGFRYEGEVVWGSFYNAELYGVEHRAEKPAGGE